MKITENATNRFEDQYHIMIDRLKELNYSRRTLNRYRFCFEKVQNLLEESEKAEAEFDAMLCNWVIDQLYCINDYSNLTQNEKNEIFSIQSIYQYCAYGTLSVSGRCNKTIRFDGPLSSCITSYIAQEAILGRAPRTLETKSLYLKRFETYLLKKKHITSWEFLGRCDLLDYFGSLCACSPAVIAHCFTTLRGFLHYLYEEQITSKDLATCVPVTAYRSDAHLPSTYSKAEVAVLLSSINQASPQGKRDYAILLLIIYLGLRASDVAALKFKDIDWESNTLSILQVKTQEPVTLPLRTEIGEALYRYLKYGRPTSNSPNVFLTAGAPFFPFTSGGPVSNIVRKYLKMSSISIQGRSTGSHALRFSLGKLLLEAKTPLPIIATIFGHTSVKTTMRYLSIDENSLRQCALEIPLYCHKEGNL